MSKTKNKTHDQVEHLRGLIRKQKSIIRHLKKRVAELTRREHYYDSVNLGTELDDEADFISDNGGDCPSCGKTDLIVTDLYRMILKKCPMCGYDERMKRNEKT